MTSKILTDYFIDKQVSAQEIEAWYNAGIGDAGDWIRINGQLYHHLDLGDKLYIDGERVI